MDYLYHLYSDRANYGSSPMFVDSENLPATGYASLYAIDELTAQAIKQAGSAQGFKGVVWSKRLWLDFDSYESAERAESKLIELGVDYVAYDTGGRGAHFGILRNATAASHLLPKQDRQWVQREFPEADRSIYTHLHPFRLPGTVHEKTGRRKELVSERRGNVLQLPPLEREEIASSPLGRVERGERSLFSCFRLMAATRPAYNGDRHATLVKIIYALKDDAGASAETALWWASEWNKMLDEPKDYSAIEKAVQSIYA